MDYAWECFGGLLWVFSRRRVVQVFARGARILDGSYMTQDLSFGASNSESNSSSESSTVSSVSIADPYVLLRMSDGTVQLLVGGMIWYYAFCYLFSLYVTAITLFLVVVFYNHFGLCYKWTSQSLHLNIWGLFVILFFTLYARIYIAHVIAECW